MSEHDPGAAMLGRIGDDVAERETGAALVTDVARDVDAARLLVDVRDPQAFPLRIAIGEAAGEKGPRGREAIELQRVFGTLISHARNLCDGR
jgi:hypothetical protein